MGATERLNFVRSLQRRYETADPFQIAVRLNIQVEWIDGCDGYSRYILGQPVIFLNAALKGSSQSYWPMAHELGHILLHQNAPSYYHVQHGGCGYTKAEYEADSFGLNLLTLLYVEDYGSLPDTYHDLQCAYGLPTLENQTAING